MGPWPVGIAFVDLGFLNNIVALGIAVVKATVVIMYFMHLKYSAKVTWLCAAAGAVFLVIMLALTLSDFLSREFIPYPDSWL